MVAWASTGGIGIADGPLRGEGIRQGLESGLEDPEEAANTVGTPSVERIAAAHRDGMM